MPKMLNHHQIHSAVFLIATFILLPELSLGQVTHSFTEPIEKRELAASQLDVVGELRIREGSQVKANEVLAELDNRVLKQSLKIAELRASSNSGIESAEANFSITKQKFEKLRPMLERGHANPAEVEKARAEFEKPGQN